MLDYIRLYLAFLHARMAHRAAHRANALIWLVGFLVEPLIYLMVWAAVAEARSGSIGGYDASDFAAYYTIMLIVRQATSAPDPGRQARRISKGDMNYLLLRPIHPFHGDLASNLTAILSTLTMLIPIVVIVSLIFNARFEPPLWSAAAFLPALIFASLLRFLIQYAMSVVGFWTDQVDGIWSTYWALQTFLSGMMAPLSLLPVQMQALASILPFRWIFTFPVDLALGHLSVGQALIGFMVQIAWILVSAVSMVWLWQKGIRRYGAFGD